MVPRTLARPNRAPRRGPPPRTPAPRCAANFFTHFPGIYFIRGRTAPCLKGRTVCSGTPPRPGRHPPSGEATPSRPSRQIEARGVGRALPWPASGLRLDANPLISNQGPKRGIDHCSQWLERSVRQGRMRLQELSPAKSLFSLGSASMVCPTASAPSSASWCCSWFWSMPRISASWGRRSSVICTCSGFLPCR